MHIPVYIVFFISREVFRFSYCTVSSTTLSRPSYSPITSLLTRRVCTLCIPRALAITRGHFFFRANAKLQTDDSRRIQRRNSRTAVDLSRGDIATRAREKKKRKERKESCTRSRPERRNQASLSLRSRTNTIRHRSSTVYFF